MRYVYRVEPEDSEGFRLAMQRLEHEDYEIFVELRRQGIRAFIVRFPISFEVLPRDVANFLTPENCIFLGERVRIIVDAQGTSSFTPWETKADDGGEFVLNINLKGR